MAAGRGGPLVPPSLHGLRARASAWFASTTYVRKWLALGAIVGVVAGLGALAFYEALVGATRLFLGILAGYEVPTPVGEGLHAASSHFARPWALPLVVAGGGLLAALLVNGIAPDAEGHGTDAAIDAVHHAPRGIRLRTVAVKIVASAFTIGSGGSGGREGPTGQISAGFGSFLARLFDLTDSDARIAVASGIGSGIGAIFGAPLGGSVLATEIMYRDDFEVEALVPAFIASIVGHVVFGSVRGFGPLFGYAGSFRLAHAPQLLWFAVIGIAGGLMGLAYSKGFYGIADVFHRSPVPRVLRPAIGGLLVGCLALAVPEVLGTGYGWIQQGLGRGLLHVPLWVVLLLPFARIVATGLSIGSGGSGGIFGPGMVIGAFVGAGVWRLAEPVVPSLGADPSPYVVVGMMACFGSIARAPLAIMLMVAEMTGSLNLIVPAMVAVGLATLVVHSSDDTIYRSQLRNRAESPSHRVLAGLPLLASLSVADAMSPPRHLVEAGAAVAGARARLEAAGVDGAPVVDPERRYLGVVSPASLAEPHPAGGGGVDGATDTSVAPVRDDMRLDALLERMSSASRSWNTVVDADRRVVGTIAISDVVRAYRRALQASLRRIPHVAADSGLAEVTVGDASVLVGATFRSGLLPKGSLVTAVERGREVFQPTGDTLICAGDRMTVLGGSADLALLREIAAPEREPEPEPG